MIVRCLRWSFFVFLASIPFGAKKFIWGLGPTVDEYRSIFLYASDIALIVFLVFFLLRGNNFLRNLRGKSFLLIFLFFAGFSIFLAAHGAIAAYQFVRLLLLVLGMFATVEVLRRGFVKFHAVLEVLAASALFQAILGLIQFKLQRSAGLWFLGEPVGTALTKGIGTIAVQGGLIIRAFGTMPHANILAAFLILGLVALLYLYLRCRSLPEAKANWQMAAFPIAIFFVMLGLTLTFSRSGWITAGIATFIILVWGILKKDYRRQAIFLLVVLLTTFYFLLSILGWAIFPRASFSPKETSIQDRFIFNIVGLEIIGKNPFGVGIGNELDYAIEKGLYQKAGLSRPPSWQPIHNLYLLTASEIGILGLLALLIFIAQFAAAKNIFLNLESAAAATLLAFVLIFGLFDHFFWDLQAGKLMFWLVLGILISASPRSVTG